jgi:hypothetical protein
MGRRARQCSRRSAPAGVATCNSPGILQRPSAGRAPNGRGVPAIQMPARGMLVCGCMLTFGMVILGLATFAALIGFVTFCDRV